MSDTFYLLQMLDSRLGKRSLLALHFLSKSSAAFIVPLNAMYAQSLCEKVSSIYLNLSLTASLILIKALVHPLMAAQYYSGHTLHAEEVSIILCS